ncbi:methionine synthase, vitamin-B12 independent [Hyaloraphidium curvatum]|nr:methionine synthase, vitamin-B12 independent [Hyaloraphidium curvatum]
MGRESFFTYVRLRMTGFGGQGSPRGFADMFEYEGFMEKLLQTHFASDAVSLVAPPACTGEVTYPSTAAVDAEIARLQDVLARRRERGEKVFQDAFMSSASPGIVAAGMENKFYPDMKSYIQALGKALAVEYKAITDAGLVLQIDAPDLAMERHTLFRDKPLEEFVAFAATVVDAINAAIEPLPKDRVRLHVCYGNYNGPHDLDVALADIWPTIAKCTAGAILLSLANPRHSHEWRVLPGSYKGTIVVGAIDTTTSYVEHPEVVADSLERAASKVGRDKVMAGTDCGFETSAGFGPVVEGIVWAKLKALAEGAKVASKRLWGGEASAVL